MNLEQSREHSAIKLVFEVTNIRIDFKRNVAKFMTKLSCLHV